MTSNQAVDIRTIVKDKFSTLMKDAVSYLNYRGVDPGEVFDIIEALEDDTPADYSILEAVHDLADPADEGDVYHKIDEGVYVASKVIKIAQGILDDCEEKADINDLISAMDLCIQLYRNLFAGVANKMAGDELRTEINSKDALKRLGNSIGGKNSQKKRRMQKNGQDYDEQEDQTDDEMIEEEFINLCDSGKNTMNTNNQKFIIRKNGQMSRYNCAEYLYEKHNVRCQELGRRPLLNLQLHTIYKKILNLTSEDGFTAEERAKLEQEILVEGF